MGLCGSPEIPDPGKAAVAGLQADTEMQPFSYLINAASTTGRPVTIGGRTFDFTGLGRADTAGRISDKMAALLLELQREKSPQIIAARIEELKAADPQGYAARQQLFERILADAQANPDRPVASELQSQLQAELGKGVGFNDRRQLEQVQEGVRGGQVKRGIFLGNAPAAQEAQAVVSAGESLRSQREQNALKLLESGASPEDVAYRRMQQSLANLGNFVSGQTPTAQFGQVSGAARGPVNLQGGTPQIGFNQGAAGQGMNNALDTWSAQNQWNQSQANPWLAGLSIGANAYGTLNRINQGQQP